MGNSNQNFTWPNPKVPCEDSKAKAPCRCTEIHYPPDFIIFDLNRHIFRCKPIFRSSLQFKIENFQNRKLRGFRAKDLYGQGLVISKHRALLQSVYYKTHFCNKCFKFIDFVLIPFLGGHFFYNGQRPLAAGQSLIYSDVFYLMKFHQIPKKGPESSDILILAVFLTLTEVQQKF